MLRSLYLRAACATLVVMLRTVSILLALCLVACSGDDDGSDPSAAGSGGSGDEAGSGGNAGSAAFGSSAGSGSGAGSGGGSGFDNDADASVGSGNDGGGGVGGFVDGSVPTDPLGLCGGPCACADGIDNDDDGLVDGFDSECIGASDDDEGSFATGIPGDNVDPKWQDCFFDGNSGAGDDGCRYSTDCFTGELDQDDRDCQVSQECIDFCQPRTPNGCDCFGCCTFTLADGTERSVILEASCEEEHLEDCTECVPTTNDCKNECEDVSHRQDSS